MKTFSLAAAFALSTLASASHATEPGPTATQLHARISIDAGPSSCENSARTMRTADDVDEFLKTCIPDEKRRQRLRPELLAASKVPPGQVAVVVTRYWGGCGGQNIGEPLRDKDELVVVVEHYRPDPRLPVACTAVMRGAVDVIIVNDGFERITMTDIPVRRWEDRIPLRPFEARDSIRG